jgi:hypothetical protein
MAQVPGEYVAQLRKRLEEVTDKGEFWGLMRRFDEEVRDIAYYHPSSTAVTGITAPGKQNYTGVDYSRPIYQRYQGQ